MSNDLFIILASLKFAIKDCPPVKRKHVKMGLALQENTEQPLWINSPYYSGCCFTQRYPLGCERHKLLQIYPVHGFRCSCETPECKDPESLSPNRGDSLSSEETKMPPCSLWAPPGSVRHCQVLSCSCRLGVRPCCLHPELISSAFLRAAIIMTSACPRVKPLLQMLTDLKISKAFSVQRFGRSFEKLK